ncbi:52 kDa repressor of the inhibitor of the protein kinase-like [Camponotus floridanus]|uniref:52 kDa repressor of the inhibitor of the protein kinase-like n=1 Tax=Camponotus floridanus TaxID=104421 RepID=UPI000DC6B6B2|nr:52 kDa repressor of the inhibitor of the protein kinase-like [Camponotus floridanus]
MDKKTKQWCAVPGCMSFINLEKRHFFRFPKEYDRWLKWIDASKRMDLKLKGPKYAYQNCTLCHLHFEDKWLIKKAVIRLHPDAVPTIFFGPAFQKENTEIEGRTEGASITTLEKQQEATRNEMEEAEKTPAVQEGSKSNVQTKEMDIQTEDQIDDKDKDKQ